MFSFACQKRTRKAPATFEAREAAGCGSLRLLCALDGTRILQAAAPTAPPCFGHWPRSSPLQTRGYTPLVTPKKMGSIQKIQAAPLWPYSAGILFLICKSEKSADFSDLLFHGRGRNGKRHMLLSACGRRAATLNRRNTKNPLARRLGFFVWSPTALGLLRACSP